MKLLRTLRLDPSDTFVFEKAAAPGEWAVPGTFMFWDQPHDDMAPKRRAAFRSGFLGLGSLGWATLVEVVEADAAAHASAVDSLAKYLHESFGAPDLTAARAAAEEELAAAASIAAPPAGAIIALQRTLGSDGEIRERYRNLKPALDPAANTFGQGCVRPIGIARDDASSPSAGDEIEEPDLVGLLGASNRPEGGG